MNNTAILSVCAAGLAATVFAANPILPLWECIPDGEPHVFEDPDNPGMMRVYLYGSHDNRVVSYCGRDQVVWSARVDDLNKWRFDGVAFRSIYGADGKQLNKNGLGDVLFAPDVCETKDANGKKTYWLYPNTQAWGRNGQIAKSDRPDGPFVTCNWTPGKPRETYGILRFDPGVLVDDDGRVYGYWGFRQSFAAELEPKTMCTVKPGTSIVTNMVSSCEQDGEFRFFEASSIRKVMGKYVFVYSRWTGNGEFGLNDNNYTLAYAYSDKPLGPWTYGGTIIDGRGREKGPDGKTRITATPGGNTHGSICEINGRWWVFYHRQASTTEYSRQAMVAPLDVKVEGGKVAIKEAEYTSEGFETNGLDPFERHAGGIASRYTGPEPARQHYPRCEYSGPWNEPEKCEGYEFKDPYDPKVNRCALVHCTDGSTAGYKYFNFSKTEGKKNLRLIMNLVPEAAEGKIEVFAGEAKIGEIVLSSSLKDAPQEVSIPVDAPAKISGKHELFFKFSSPVKNRSICRILDFRFAD